MTDSNRFDQAAATWDRKKRRRELARAVADGILALNLAPETTALEYGCGTGLVGLAIAPRIRHLTAVDTSTAMLDILTHKAEQAGLDNVRPLCLDLVTGPLPKRFDLIFCSMTLHHIPETDLVLNRFMEMLSPKGWLALADLDLEDGSFHGPGTEGVHHHGFDRDELSRRIEQLGGRDAKSRTIYTFEKKDHQDRKRSYTVFLLTARKKDCP